MLAHRFHAIVHLTESRHGDEGLAHNRMTAIERLERRGQTKWGKS
jgi:hypothetical protein